MQIEFKFGSGIYHETSTDVMAVPRIGETVVYLFRTYTVIVVEYDIAQNNIYIVCV